jgi:hypothetical protein
VTASDEEPRKELEKDQEALSRRKSRPFDRAQRHAVLSENPEAGVVSWLQEINSSLLSIEEVLIRIEQRGL